MSLFRKLLPRALPAWAILPCVVSAVLGQGVAAQRGLLKLTSSSQSHFDAKVSPDGKFVVFRSAGKFGVVDIGGSKEQDLVSSSSLGSFVWAPNSSGIYYVDGSAILFVSRSGGKPIQIGTVPGTLAQIWSVDAKDTKLFGSRADSQAKYRFIFTLATDGKSNPVDVTTSLNSIDQVIVDAAGKRFAYRHYAPTPHQPIELRAADIDGKNDVSLTGTSGISSIPSGLFWLDGGTKLAFTYANFQSQSWQIGYMTTSSSTVVPLSDGSRSHRSGSITADLAWVVHEATTAMQTTAVGIMPADGGGRVMLEPETNLILQGEPSIDAAGTVVVFAATLTKLSSQVYAVKLDREIRVSPQVAVGQTTVLRLPLDNGEAGIVFLSIGLLQKPVPLGGYAYAVAIDPTYMLPILQGTGSGSGPLTLPVKVPNIPALKGAELFLQGIRSKDGKSGDLTRYVEVLIF